MAGQRVKLEVQDRESRGTRASRRLRREGLVPGVFYGQGSTPHAICIPERELRRVLTGSGGLHAILDVVVDGGSSKARPAILKDYQVHPIRGTLVHVDLQEVRLDQAIQASVVVQLIGEPVGVKEGGVLTQVSREINVEALPMAVPEHLEADVSAMAIGDTLRLADLPAPEGVTFLDDPDETVLASVTTPTRVVEPEELVTEEEAEEGVEGEPGEEAPEGASEGAAESDADAAASSGTTPG